MNREKAIEVFEEIKNNYETDPEPLDIVQTLRDAGVEVDDA